MRENLLILIFALQIASLTIYDSGTMSGLAQYKELFFNTTPGFNTLNIQFEVTNSLASNLVAVAAFTPIPQGLTLSNISSYFATGSSALNSMDPISAIAGNQQNLNIALPNSTNSTIIYITLFNFDLPSIITDKTFALTLNFLANGKICTPCPYGSTLIYNITNPLQCQCAPCPPNHVGSACQYALATLVQMETQERDILGHEDAYYRITSTGSTIDLLVEEVTHLNSVMLYIQYEYEVGQLAGKLNCFYNKDLLPFSVLITKSKHTVSIPSNGFNILLTFQNSGSALATIALVYSSKSSSSNKFIIILGTCSSLLVLVIALVICKIYKNYRIKQLMTVRQDPIPHNSKKTLENNEVDRFFPEISVQSFYQQMKNPTAEHNQPQCSICFDKMLPRQAIRITYCKHAFHSLCLEGWFAMTQKCPDCNKIFDISTSDEIRSRALEKDSDLGLSLTKSFWENTYNKESKLPQDKTDFMSESKSFEQIEIQDYQSNQEDLNR